MHVYCLCVTLSVINICAICTDFVKLNKLTKWRKREILNVKHWRKRWGESEEDGKKRDGGDEVIENGEGKQRNGGYEFKIVENSFKICTDWVISIVDFLIKHWKHWIFFYLMLYIAWMHS